MNSVAFLHSQIVLACLCHLYLGSIPSQSHFFKNLRLLFQWYKWILFLFFLSWQKLKFHLPRHREVRDTHQRCNCPAGRDLGQLALFWKDLFCLHLIEGLFFFNAVSCVNAKLWVCLRYRKLIWRCGQQVWYVHRYQHVTGTTGKVIDILVDV